jgi:adenine/guanine/hypoxanthine permease
VARLPGLPSALGFLVSDMPQARETSLSREIVAGLTTFGAMGYIVIVNPQILSATGADRHVLIVITALAAMFGTIVMALFSRLPVALAPAMGSNIVFSQVVVVRMGLSYGTALVMVLLGGVLFTLLSVSNLRSAVVRGFPESIRVGLQCGIGLFIAYLGLVGGGLVRHAPSGAPAFGDLTMPATLLTFAGLLITPVLMLMRVRGALLLSIVAITLCGLVVPGPHGGMLTVLPSRPVQWPSLPRQFVFGFDFRQFADHFFLALPVALYFFLGDFFSATATLIGVTRRAGLMTPDGQFPNARRAYLADGIASLIGACIGSPTVAAYVESATGVESGGRTGLTALVVAALFGLSVFFWPLIAAIPAQATCPALVMVGILMMDGIRHIDHSRFENPVSAVLILLLTVTTGNLMVGLCTGCFAYTLMMVGLREWRRLTPVLLLIDAMLVLYLYLSATSIA